MLGRVFQKVDRVLGAGVVGRGQHSGGDGTAGRVNERAEKGFQNMLIEAGLS